MGIPMKKRKTFVCDNGDKFTIRKVWRSWDEDDNQFAVLVRKGEPVVLIHKLGDYKSKNTYEIHYLRKVPTFILRSALKWLGIFGVHIWDFKEVFHYRKPESRVYNCSHNNNAHMVKGIFHDLSRKNLIETGLVDNDGYMQIATTLTPLTKAKMVSYFPGGFHLKHKNTIINLID